MQRQFKTARKMCKMKLFEAAELLGVSQPTLSSWESGRKSPTIDSVLKMAALYNVSTDFLLGNSLMGKVEENRKTDRRIPHESLRIMHGQPVWSNEYGWMIVDSINNCLIAPDGVSIKFYEAESLYFKADTFCEEIIPKRVPLTRDELCEYDRVWVEPISTDITLRNELRGWYRVKHHAIENECGNRFSLDSYMAKWLAFSDIYL